MLQKGPFLTASFYIYIRHTSLRVNTGTVFGLFRQVRIESPDTVKFPFHQGALDRVRRYARRSRADQLVQFDLQRLGITVLRTLHQKDHQKCYDSGTRIAAVHAARLLFPLAASSSCPSCLRYCSSKSSRIFGNILPSSSFSA
jgi:hypothetical protein